MRAIVKAHRWPACILAAAATGLSGYLSRTSFIHLPIIQEMVPARLLIAILAVTIAVTPLYPVFPELTSTLLRERTVRATRPLGAVVLTLLAYAPSAANMPESRTETACLYALLTIGLLAIVTCGQLAWAVILAAGFAVVLVDATPGTPVTVLLDRVTSTVLLTGVAVGVLLTAVLGPRAWKSLE